MNGELVGVNKLSHKTNSKLIVNTGHPKHRLLTYRLKMVIDIENNQKYTKQTRIHNKASSGLLCVYQWQQSMPVIVDPETGFRCCYFLQYIHTVLFITVTFLATI